MLRLIGHANWLAQLIFWPYGYEIDYGQSNGAIKVENLAKYKRDSAQFSNIKPLSFLSAIVLAEAESRPAV